MPRAHVRELARASGVDPLSADEKVADGLARRAVRYGRRSAFFMDERSFPEPGGFWLGGARDSAVVLQPDEPRASLALQLRNAPIDNVVTPGAARGVRRCALRRARSAASTSRSTLPAAPRS